MSTQPAQTTTETVRQHLSTETNTAPHDEVHDVRSHLERRGYVVSVPDASVPGYLHARHLRRPNIIVRVFRGAVRLNVLFRLHCEGTKDRLAKLELVNALNRDDVGTQFCVNAKGDLAGQAWYCGPYEAAAFDRFLEEVWGHDVALILRSDDFRRLVRPADAATK